MKMGLVSVKYIALYFWVVNFNYILTPFRYKAIIAHYSFNPKDI